MSLQEICMKEDYVQLDAYLKNRNLGMIFIEVCNLKNLNVIKYIGDKLKVTDEWKYYSFYKNLSTSIAYNNGEWECLNYILYSMPSNCKVVIKRGSFLYHLLKSHDLDSLEQYFKIIRIDISQASKEELLLRYYNNPRILSFIEQNNLLPSNLLSILIKCASEKNVNLVKHFVKLRPYIRFTNVEEKRAFLGAFCYLGDYELFEWANSRNLQDNYVERIFLYNHLEAACLGGNIKIVESLNMEIQPSIFYNRELSLEMIEYLLTDELTKKILPNLDSILRVSPNSVLLGLSTDIKPETLVEVFQPKNRLRLIEPHIGTKITPSNWKSKFVKLCKFEINLSRQLPPIKRKLEIIQENPFQIWKYKMTNL